MKATIHRLALLAGAATLAACTSMGGSPLPPAGVHTLVAGLQGRRHPGATPRRQRADQPELRRPERRTTARLGQRARWHPQLRDAGVRPAGAQRAGGGALGRLNNIPASVTAFADNEISGPSPKYTGGKSTLNLPNYMGPCPP